MSQHHTRPRRRGAHSIEFALILPFFGMLLSATIEYGWLGFVQHSLSTATWQGCRRGATQLVGDLPTPEDAAADGIREALTGYSFRDIDCASGTDSRCTATATMDGSSPSAALHCTLSIDYPPITGFVPTPETLKASALVLLETQEET